MSGDASIGTHAEYFSVLSEVTAKLAAAGAFSGRINEILEIIGNKTLARRTYIVLDDPQGGEAKVAYEWLETGTASPNPPEKLFYAGLPYFRQLLAKDGNIIAKEVKRLPEDLVAALNSVERESWIAIPLVFKGGHFGFLGLDDCRKKIVFEKGSSVFFGVLAAIISGAFSQNNYFAALNSLSANSSALSDTIERQQFKRIFELNPNPMSVNDIAHGAFTEVNEAFLAKIKYTRAEVIGKTPLELGLFPDWQKYIGATEKLRDRENFSNVLLVVCDKNGEMLQGLFSGTTIRFGEKKLGLVVMVDMTEQTNLSKRIEEQKVRLEGVLKASNIGTWAWDIQTGETTIDERIAKMLGYEMRELSPEFPLPEWETIMVTDLTRFLHPEDALLSREVLQRHFRKETEYYSCELRMKHKNGSWIWVHNRGKVTAWTADGRPQIMHGTYADINGRKTTAKTVEDNEKRLNAMLSNLPDVVSLLDESGKIKYLSPNFERLFGWKQEDLLGRTAFELVHDDDRERVKAEYFNHQKTPDSTTITNCRLKCADGSFRLVELTTKNLLHNPSVNAMILSGHPVSNEPEKRSV